MLISAKEEPEASIPPAKDGLLKVHQRVIDAKHMVFIESVIVFNGLDCYTVFQVIVFNSLYKSVSPIFFIIGMDLICDVDENGLNIWCSYRVLLYPMDLIAILFFR